MSIMKFTQLLEKIGDRLEIHAEFINTLSLLEYIGARKIIKSQTDREITEELLSHIAEEIRHSQVLKHLALKLSKNRLTTYENHHLLAANEGKAYIQTVDRAVEKLLLQKNVWKNYLLTTLLIEERATLIYPLYNGWLENLGYSNRFLSIIRDEDKHLTSVTSHLQKADSEIDILMSQLRPIEDQAFDRFMDAVLLQLS